MKPVENADETEPAISPKYLIILGVLVVALVGYLIWAFMLGGPPSVDALAARALSAADLNDRKRAAVDLSTVDDRQAALPHLRRLAQESKDPEVLVIALHRLVVLGDRESFPLVFNALNDPEEDVRRQAYADALFIFGEALPNNLEYKVDDDPEARARVAAKLKEIHDNPAATPKSGT